MQASRGLRPVFSKSVMEEKGETCRTQEDCNKRWNKHLERVLNIRSEFDMSATEAVWQQPLHTDLDSVPTLEKLDQALQAVTCMCGKAG